MENPVPEASAPPASPGAPISMMARLGRNEQLLIGGAAAVVLADIIGALTQDWSLDLNHWLLILGSLAAAAIVLSGVGRAIAGLPARSIVRIAAAIVGSYGLIELGALISDFDGWSAINIVLTIVEVAGAGTLMFAAWAIDGASLASDIAGASGAIRMEMIDRFVYLGAIGVIVGWFLLMVIAQVYNFNVESQVAVLGAVLVLSVRWLARNPAAGTLPMSRQWTITGLAAVSVLLGLWWFIKVIGKTLEIGDLTIYAPLLLYILALVSLGLGAFLGLGRLPAPAARS
jgi:hypothetical protein